MHRSILFLFTAVLLATQQHAHAQNIQKQDSVLTTWANDLARYSRYSCADVQKAVMDSAVHIIAPHNSYKDARILSVDGEYVVPMDSACVAFLVKERIRNELLK